MMEQDAAAHVEGEEGAIVAAVPSKKQQQKKEVRQIRPCSRHRSTDERGVACTSCAI